MNESERLEMIDRLDGTVLQVAQQAKLYKDFVNEMVKRGYTRDQGFHCLNNFHQYFEAEGPFWSSILLARISGKIDQTTTVTRDNLRSIVNMLQNEGIIEQNDDIERKMTALRVFEEKKQEHPTLRLVSWENCHTRAKEREEEVANFMYDCMITLLMEHDFQYSRDIEG